MRLVTIIISLLFLVGCTMPEIESSYSKSACYDTAKQSITTEFKQDISKLNFERIRCESVGRRSRFEAEGTTEGKQFYILRDAQGGSPGGGGWLARCMVVEGKKIISYSRQEGHAYTDPPYQPTISNETRCVWE
ncbi:hypothetical protein KY310_03190 [Candidatus Woesearchaeota archaeon]|nr:hypothetical protein [Candidatus Woesearchaeota archaeon]